jgi:cation diffusion facilitator CzcD-associated flavoprotein CzcO
MRGGKRYEEVLAREPRVAIVGAGMSGLLMGIKLLQAGFRDFTIFEKSEAIGGTWRDNRYPGLVCDIPSRFFSFSFAPNPGWTHVFSPQSEILAYLEQTAERYGLWNHIQLGTPVESAVFEEGRWSVRTPAGEDLYDFLLSATGILHHPRVPDIEGFESFAGQAFHTARWPRELDLEGKRVGIVGNGATGIQVVETIGSQVGQLTLFQRTPHWVFPLPNRRYSRFGRWLMRRFPRLNRLGYQYYQALYEKILTAGMVKPGWRRSVISWMTRRHLHVIRDRGLRRKLTPDFSPMCKRIVRSTRFYPTMNQDNVNLVTNEIERMQADGILTTDGTLHELDVLVLATGFDAHAFMRPLQLVGEEGTTLEEAWAGDPRSYLTVALPKFPNFFMLVGPYSPYGHQSVIMISETQADYVVQWVRMWARGEVERMAPTEDALRRFEAEVREALPNTIWTSGCDSWYLNSSGVPALWPWEQKRHRELLREPVLEDFEIVRGPTVRDLAGVS